MKKKTAWILIIAVAAVLAGASVSKLGVWHWARKAGARSIAYVTPWNNGTDLAPLSGEETAELILLLNGLELDAFTKNKGLTGGTPTYGVRITTPTGELYINEAFAPAGGLEIRYGGTLWWIADQRLQEFVRAKAVGK